MFGLSWEAASLFIFTPWFGFGIQYEAPSFMYYNPTVLNGAWVGWGRNIPLVDGGFRYMHTEDRTVARYCPELDRYGD
jgi:hypothetical protein